MFFFLLFGSFQIFLIFFFLNLIPSLRAITLPELGYNSSESVSQTDVTAHSISKESLPNTTVFCRLQVASKFMPVSSLIIGECNIFN